MADNTQIVLVETPKGELAESHFELRQSPLPTPEEGQLLVRNILLSQDAANRAWMQGATYRAAVNPGDVMHGYAIGEVVESRAAGFSPGDVVAGEIGWQEFAALDAKSVQRCSDHRPLSHLHSVLGIAGKTAYHGLLNVPGIAEGETLVVSAAAGSVGSLVGQIGKIKGAHVVGIAGGAEKCDWVQAELGFDACIDYKNDDVSARLSELCPGGIDVYFDNVGGNILQSALFAMKLHGRISCCGAVSQYDGGSPASPVGIPGLLVVKRLRMEGFIVMDFLDRDQEAERDLKQWLESGQLKVIEDILDGLENAPRGLIGLLAGENRGKRMIRVGPDPA
ncbi:MAG: NADP-dependent oxidoreductase [Deltaproteobacteria bacterium]|nr:NADP-dependent oxidoreductase [Deltaproteobacteria bacterium]MBW2393292.1 NADP-dependent oxidoreductase [Deltaproteobacteria bacterium]